MATCSASQGPEPFLADLDLRPLPLPDPQGMESVGLALGQGRGALEVAVTRSAHRPTQAVMRTVWKGRHGGRAVPLLLVALHGDRAAICGGPGGDEPPVYLDLDRGMVERLCRAALAEPDRHAASRFLRAAIPELETPLLALRGRPLLQGLGFQIEDLPGHAAVLRAGAAKIAVAIFLDRSESCDVASDRFGGLSPISYALDKATAENLPYVVVDHGSALRIYPTATGAGVGRRGRTETFIEIHLDLLPTDKAAYLWFLFSGSALTRGGTFDDILAASGRFAADLGARLRTRIYNDVIPDLAMAIVAARGLKKPTAQDLEVPYEMALTVLFRLLFIAYAEDKNLLPYETNERYRARSLKHKAAELLELRRAGSGFDPGDTLSREVTSLFRAINKGHTEWGVPAYNGGLFADAKDVSPVGALIAGLSLPNTAFGPALTNLLLDEASEGWGPVDFRSLSVREFGTIYEGLLESELSVAEVNLAVDPKSGLYFPAEPDEKPPVRAGQVYLHNAGGARKATGSYYTKDFAVDHLLDHALEPALAEHHARLDKLDDRRAAEAFFDFRVADIAMGSGHFLVSAVDRIERSLSGYLARRRLPGVTDELHRLRQAALKELKDAGGEGEGIEIEDTQLLRRQIARRCVYGVDIKQVAVDLARLSLWIHTFVPGLPLSFLDHNIVCGNSLVGIATFDEVEEIMGLAGAPGLFDRSAEALVGSALGAVLALGRLSDANAAEIVKAREAFNEQKVAIADTAQLFDVLTAARLPESGISVTSINLEEVQDTLFLEGLHRRACEVLVALPPFHFPIAFPEVFLGDHAGFDVIVGNPPWEEATVEEDRFWNRYVPGLQAMPQHEQERVKRLWRKNRPDLVKEYETELSRANALRLALVHGPFPGMGTGDPDAYKAFLWRFWNLLAPVHGRIGVVLPRSALSAKGSSVFRFELFKKGSINVIYLINNGGWVFDDAEWRYTIALTAISRQTGSERTISLKGPFRSKDRLVAGISSPAVTFAADDALEWTDTAALPLLPAEESAEVFAQLRKAPRLDLNDGRSWRARPYTELHATNDKPLMKLVEKQPKGYWPVFKGESFDIWQADTGAYYAWADPEKLLHHLQVKRQRARNRERSPFAEFTDPAWFNSMRTLPCMGPRIAFRDVTNRTNQRTVVAALVPPEVFIANQAPYLLWPRGDEKDLAYLLGLLCSIPLDWYARRFVETHVNYHVFNPFPVPRPSRKNRLWRRTVELAGRLAAADARFAEWAETVGVEFGPLDVDEKEDMIHELDAVVAHLYGLSEAHLVHVFETFHEGWEYHPRLEAVLRHYGQWRGRL